MAPTSNGRVAHDPPNNVEHKLGAEDLQNLMLDQGNHDAGCSGSCASHNCHCQHCRCQLLYHNTNNQNAQDYGGAGRPVGNDHLAAEQVHHAESVNSLESGISSLTMDAAPEMTAAAPERLTKSRLQALHGQQRTTDLHHEAMQRFINDNEAPPFLGSHGAYHRHFTEQLQDAFEAYDHMAESTIFGLGDTVQSVVGLTSASRSELLMSEMTSASASAFLPYMGVRFNGQPLIGPTPYLRLSPDYGCPHARFYGQRNI